MGKPHGPEVVAKARELNDQGVSKREISRTLGICYSSARRFTSYRHDAIYATRVRTHINGVQHRTQVEKRPRPDHCEICGGSAKRHETKLDWHHWDDSHLEWGIWVCNRCHIGAGFVERGYDEKYKELKGKIECST